MTDVDLGDRFSVLLLEGSFIHGELFERWLAGVPTKVATTPADLFRAFDSSVAVACLSQRVLEADEEAIRQHILTRNPHCQLVLLASRSSFDALLEQQYDATITRPVFEEELQTTVETRLKYGIYSTLLDKFYSLNAELVSLRRADKSEVDLGRDWVEEQLREVKGSLDRFQSTIDHDDVRELLRSEALHRRYLTEPAQDAGSSTTSKFHPDSCPNCDLPWGIDHGNELGTGFTLIGAYVRRCTRCKDITHGSGPSDRHIARR